ncbi:MAG: methylamine utilization protein [Burkholderiaceae bacterium]
MVLGALMVWGGPVVALAATVQVQVQEASGAPLGGAVVFLDSPEAAKAAKPLSGAEMGQQAKSFVPEVLVVTRGTAVSFPNRDTVRHHVYSFSQTKQFELKLYTGTPANPVLFDRSGVAVLGCNIHDDMVGWIVVVDTPHFGTSAASGQVRLDNVPAGQYTLRVWHPRLPTGAEARATALRVVDGMQATTVTLSGLQK